MFGLFRQSKKMVDKTSKGNKQMPKISPTVIHAIYEWLRLAIPQSTFKKGESFTFSNLMAYMEKEKK